MINSRLLGVLGFMALASSVAQAALPAGYQRLSAEEKQDLLLANIRSDRYTGELPTDGPGLLDMLGLVKRSFLVESFTHDSDEMPEGRKKLIHTYGSTAAVDFRVTKENPFTGLFQSGAIGFARISTAIFDPNDMKAGMGLKFLIDGRYSINWQVMYSLDGQGVDNNVFSWPFSNVINPPQNLNFVLKKMLKAFRETIAWLKSDGSAPESELELPLDEAASFASNGEQVAQPMVPYRVHFIPEMSTTRMVGEWLRKNPGADFRQSLAQIPVSTVLYRVYARLTPESQAVEIGELVTTTKFVASRYQDEKLFFQHSRYRHAQE